MVRISLRLCVDTKNKSWSDQSVSINLTMSQKEKKSRVLIGIQKYSAPKKSKFTMFDSEMWMSWKAWKEAGKHSPWGE